MKKLISYLAFASILTNANAYDLENFQTEAETTVGIVSIQEPETAGDDYTIFATDGRIYEIAADNEDVLEKAHIALEDQVEIELNIGENAGAEDLLGARTEILDINLQQEELMSAMVEKFYAERPELSNRSQTQKDSRLRSMLLNSYITNLDSSYEAQELFSTQRTDTRQKSQCYNRAHVWSWELSQKYYNNRRIQTGKIWVFFTSRYIKNYRYKWWFHIAPYVHVNNEVAVMDKSFTSTPVSERAWTNRFVKSQEACPVVSKYTAYRKNQWAADCYVMKSSVFYWQPWQLENVEKRGTTKVDWIEREIRKAYKNAIGRRARVPGL